MRGMKEKSTFYFTEWRVPSTFAVLQVVVEEFLDQVNGCNAAYCSENDCQATFCYLCLKQTGSYLGLVKGSPEYNEINKKTHKHVKEHSKDFWEYRPGFTDRYHWQISRKELAVTFKGKIDPEVRKAALQPHKALLEEKNMWPMPAGMKTVAWVKAVEEIPQSTRKYSVFEDHGKKRIEKTEALHTKEKKIELLQNEYIFLTHESDTMNAEVVNAALQRLGGAVIASLDVKDADYPAAVAVAGGEAAVQGGGGQGVVRQQLAVAPLNPDERLQPVLGAEQVQVFRPLGEEQYRVGG
jgi:hypothetical protein